MRSDLHAIRQRIEAGADLDAKDAFGSMPLHIAALFSHIAIVRALRDIGFGYHGGVGPRGRTPLRLRLVHGAV